MDAGGGQASKAFNYCTMHSMIHLLMSYRAHIPSSRAPGRRLGTLLLGLVAVLLTTWAAPTVAHADDAPLDLATYPKSEVTIDSAAGGRQVFRVWVADTEARQRQGLMFVRDLPADQGMLFINQPPRRAAFWMKNTYISLDLLFVDARGRILHIFERATPLSLEPLGIETPVRAVLEIKGGESQRRGIRVGDRLRHPAFVAPTPRL